MVGGMESVSRCSRGFPDEDEDDDDEFSRREVSSQRVELTVKIDGKNVEQKQPSTPRSKHSATEQRRRSKINDRFQILRDLIPHSDQKRDKASFLLEVIEYIRFLQEKVQKQELCPEMPWNNRQGSGDGPATSGYIFSGNDNGISVAPAMLSNLQNPAESEFSLQPNLYTSVGRVTGFNQPQQRLISDSSNIASQSQFQWPRSCPGDGTDNNDILNEQEELLIDEGTINVSRTYSQGVIDIKLNSVESVDHPDGWLLATLTQSLESSGLDLSQASISVQINLGKRAKRPAATATSSVKELEDPSTGNRAMGQSMVGSSGEESEQASKRLKSNNNS